MSDSLEAQTNLDDYGKRANAEIKLRFAGLKQLIEKRQTDLLAGFALALARRTEQLESYRQEVSDLLIQLKVSHEDSQSALAYDDLAFLQTAKAISSQAAKALSGSQGVEHTPAAIIPYHLGDLTGLEEKLSNFGSVGGPPPPEFIRAKCTTSTIQLSWIAGRRSREDSVKLYELQMAKAMLVKPQVEQKEARSKMKVVDLTVGVSHYRLALI